MASEQLHDGCMSLRLASLESSVLVGLFRVLTTNTGAMCVTGSQVSRAAFAQRCALPTCASKLAGECMATLVGDDSEVLRACQWDQTASVPP